MQIFRPGADSVARIVIALLAILPISVVGVGYTLVRSPYVTDQDVVRNQPVPFSHEHHVGGLGLDCRYCHASVETARFAGLPPTDTCMTCHSQLWTNAEILKPVRDSLARDVPIHWQRVHNLPDYVYFDHSVHVAKGVGCSTCHGEVDRMPLMRQAKPLTMSWCINCHRDPTQDLRPLAAVYDMHWTPPADQAALGRQRLLERHIDTARLEDCSICHR